MPPALLPVLKFVPAVLSIMDEHLHAAYRLQDGRRELLKRVVVVGDIGDARLGELEHIAEGRIRMRETEGGDADLWVDLDGVAARQFAEIDLRPEQVLHLDGKKRDAGSGPPSTRPVNTVAGLRHR